MQASQAAMGQASESYHIQLLPHNCQLVLTMVNQRNWQLSGNNFTSFSVEIVLEIPVLLGFEFLAYESR